METKRCSKCGNDLPLSAFYQRTGAKSLHSACKVCERAMAKNRHERNKDKATAQPYEKVLLHWYQARGDATSKVGDKGIIETISKQAVKVVCVNDSIKAVMVHIENNFVTRKRTCPATE